MSDLLDAAGIFFEGDRDEPDDERWENTINLNDAFSWATADGEYVPAECREELRKLFFLYGWCGVLYWVSERRGTDTAEFRDVNRKISFVRQEEAIRRAAPNDSAYAYTDADFTVSGKP